MTNFLNIPAGTSDGQTHTIGSETYVWNAANSVWNLQGRAVGGSSAGGSTTFAGLTDTPNSYAGAAGDVVQVSSTQNGLIFNQLKELASDFNANQFYERGDIVTVLGADTNYQFWVLNVASLNGRSTPITAADQPGGSNNAWQQFSGGDSLTADAVEALTLDFTTNIPQINGSNISTEDQTYIPVYFQLGSTGQAINLNLDPTTTSTHYALVRSDGYGIITVFNNDGTLASSAAASLNTLQNTDPPRVVYLPLSSNNYFAPAIDTPEQMHDDLREWVSRDFEVQLNPHPDTGTITGHTFTLGGQTGTISNVSTDGRSFDISLTDEQRTAATLAINPATDNHVDMVFTWVHNSVTHTWTNPIDLIEDLATTTTIGDFTVRRGTATGVSAGAVLHTMDAARLRLSGSTFGYFHTIASLTAGEDYVLVIDDVGSYSGGQISNGQQYRITAPAINNFGGTFTDVRLITGGNVSDTVINWTFDDIFQSENVDVSIRALETAAAGLEILSGGNVIFRLEPNGNVQIAGALTQNGT